MVLTVGSGANNPAQGNFLRTTVGNRPNPTQAVEQFKSQQVGGLLNRQTPLVNGQAGQQAQNANPVQASLDRQMQMITGGSAQRTQALLQIAAQRRQAPAKEAYVPAVGAPAKHGVVAKNGVPLKNAPAQSYTPQGSLSGSRNKVLADASSYLGTPYRLGGLSRSAIDCSGLVIAVYGKMGFKVPHNARIQGQIMGQRTSIANLRPGDLVAWNDGSHIAIYAGNGQIIEAANPRVGTVRRKLWSSAVYGVRVQLPGE